MTQLRLFGCEHKVKLMIKLSAVISVHYEEKQLAACLEKLKFADEIVVVLDR